jgi:hypothetical protein
MHTHTPPIPRDERQFDHRWYLLPVVLALLVLVALAAEIAARTDAAASNGQAESTPVSLPPSA